jgi:hypothetical protein
MRRLLVFSTGILLVQFIALIGLAQQKGLEGRWTGTIQTPRGENAATATFRRENDAYTGAITGMRGEEVSLKHSEVVGDKVTAQAEVETPRGNVIFNYSFTLKDDTLKGRGAADFGGRNITMEISLKRAVEK